VNGSFLEYLAFEKGAILFYPGFKVLRTIFTDPDKQEIIMPIE